MKAIILKQADIDALISALKEDPRNTQQEYRDAFRFYNYQVRTWIDKISE